MFGFVSFFCGKLFYLVVTLIYVVSATQDPVSITSSLKQDSLCPGDVVATFICTTVGSAVIWRINEDVISFREHTMIGQLYHRNGYSMGLLSRMPNPDGTGFIFISSLSVVHESSPTRLVQIGCHNGQRNTQRYLEYHHMIELPPPPPFNLSGTMQSFNNASNFFSISWDQESNDTISHYAVQIDSHPPFHVSAHITTLHTVIDSPDFDGGEDGHIVSVTTVDKCGQTSNSSQAVVVKQQAPTTDGLETQPQDSTGANTAAASAAAIVVAIIAVVGGAILYVGGVLTGLFVKRRRQRKTSASSGRTESTKRTESITSTESATSGSSTPSATSESTLSV